MKNIKYWINKRTSLTGRTTDGEEVAYEGQVISSHDESCRKECRAEYHFQTNVGMVIPLSVHGRAWYTPFNPLFRVKVVGRNLYSKKPLPKIKLMQSELVAQ